MTTRVADSSVRRAFEVQAEHCTKMGAPFNARVCLALAAMLDDGSALGRRVLAWPRENRIGDLVPLRCCAGFHALARAKKVSALVDVYPPNVSDERSLRHALAKAIEQEDAFLAKYLDSAPQTNEVGRSAILLGGMLETATRTDLPLALFEMGASAGLNMQFDRWRYDLGEAGTWGPKDAPLHIRCPWTGVSPALVAPLRIASRAASDLAPLRPNAPADRERLLSYIWPDQTERLSRTSTALDVAAASGLIVEKADAREWLRTRLAPDMVQGGTCTVLFHSVFIQYLDPPVRATLIGEIAARGVEAEPTKPFAWLRMEASEPDKAKCELRLTLWPDGEDRRLATVDWHGREATWTADGA